MQGHELLAMVPPSLLGATVRFSDVLHDALQPSSLVPAIALGLLSVSIVPLILAWLNTRSSPLRPALIWGLVACGFGILSQICAFTEALSTGRPWTGLVSYLWMAATLAALTSVLGARRPGTGAWALLMIMLFGVLMVPLLESSVFSTNTLRVERLRLEAPWSLFVAVVGVAGVSNYLFTRWSLSAMLIGAGLVVEYGAMISPEWPAERRALAWSIGPGLAGLAMIATLIGSARPMPSSGLEVRWIWFRDRFGVVWALRVREKFNQTAERSGWAFRLFWQGPRTSAGKPCMDDEIPGDALAAFELLIRRFKMTEER